MLEPKKLKVHSAGVKDPIGSFRAAPPARRAAVRWGFSLEDHRAELVTMGDIRWADVVLYMDNGNLGRLRDRFPFAEKKFLCLAHFAEQTRIPDPAFLALNKQEPVWELIERACQQFIRRMS